MTQGMAQVTKSQGQEGGLAPALCECQGSAGASPPSRPWDWGTWVV